MRLRELAREILASVRAQKVPAFMIAGIAAIICIAALVTVGRAAAADEQLRARMDEAGARTFTALDVNRDGFISPPVVAAVDGLTDVEVAFGASISQDVYNSYIGLGGNTVVARSLNGDLDELITIIEGRMPASGEAVISAEAQHVLGMSQPFGSITTSDASRQATVVGKYALRFEHEGIPPVIISAGNEEDSTVLFVTTKQSALVDRTMVSTREILGAIDPSKIRFDSPTSLAQLQRIVAGDLADYSTSILYGVLGVGAVLSAVVVFADALGKRADLGRRMALGATGSVITIYTMGRAVVPALIGSLLGSVGGLIISGYLGTTAPMSFALAVAILTVIVMMLSAIPGALWSARQDPVKVLRTP